MFEIKMNQGAKPGKGSILPKEKITKQIAEIRGISMGEDSTSPNRHVEIASINGLLSMINHVREVTGKPTGFKSVIGATAWIDDFFKEINKWGEACAPDFITLDSGDDEISIICEDCCHYDNTNTSKFELNKSKLK